MKEKLSEAIREKGPIEPWKTCCAKIPIGIPQKLLPRAFLTKVCDGMLHCMLRPDTARFVIEFLCPSCGFLVRKVFGADMREVYKRHEERYPCYWGECPVGKRVVIVLIQCPMCREENRENPCQKK